MSATASGTATVERSRLDLIAHLALQVGCLLTESGASVRVAHEGARLTAVGLGAEVLGIRSGYASFEITVGQGAGTVTRMRQVGVHGVNQRLDFAVRSLVARASQGRMSPDEIEAELDRLRKQTPRYPAWLVAIATGAACAAFGRLLGADWMAFIPVLVAGTVGQAVRQLLLARGINVFVVATVTGCVAAASSGFGARLTGSGTIDMAMMASILLLVPGVPSTNAQTDIMDGYPTMGSARAVWVVMNVVFAVTGLWLAEIILGMN